MLNPQLGFFATALRSHIGGYTLAAADVAHNRNIDGHHHHHHYLPDYSEVLSQLETQFT